MNKKKVNWSSLLALDFWFAVIVFGILLNLIVKYAPIGYEKLFGVNDIEKCADISYKKASGNRVKPILKENLKTKLNSDSSYRILFANCEDLKNKNPETFKGIIGN